jgi:hydrophobic/amphiphilic exporter-1 (mainly G- bacteria), HAE1 family
VIRFFVNHPVATWMLFTALIITGVYALPRLDIEAMPETELPSLSITTAWTGASPSAVQRSITIPIEECARQVHGVEEVTARSSPGRSRVQISFRRDINIEFARMELSEHLGAVRRNLPSQASQPMIVAYTPEDFRTTGFFTISLVSTLSTNKLHEKAEAWLVPRLLALPGVADAELQGGAMPIIRVLLDMELMERYHLTADGIFNRLNDLDDIFPAGAVRRSGGQLTVSIQDSVTTNKLKHAVVSTIGGQPITLSHVARLEPGYQDPVQFVRINGENVIQVNIAKRSGENAVRVSRRIRAELPEIEADLPFPVKFEIDEDQGEELEQKLKELVYRSLVILALLFVLLACALRRVRLTAIVVSSILLAIVICLSLFYFFGVSVNFITISGLTVCFGMLLDNSILVLDAIHRRLTTRNGHDAHTSLIRGTHEVAFPIIATTLTTVVAFMSFSFLSGRLSLYYMPLAASVGIAMLASIFVAFAWIPVALRGPAEKERAQALLEEPTKPLHGFAFLWRWSVAAIVVGLLVCVGFVFFIGLQRVLDQWIWAAGLLALTIVVGTLVSFIGRITTFNIRFWWVPITITLFVFAGGYYAFSEKIHKGGFWQQRSQEQLRVYIERPVGTDVVLSTETMKLFEAELLPIPEGIHMKTWSWENCAYLLIDFEEEKLYSEYPELYRNKLILLAEELGGMFIWLAGFGDPYVKGGRGGGLSNSLIKVTGYNSKQLDSICEGVVTRLSRNRRVRNVRLASGDQFERSSSDETVILINREKLAEHHLSVAAVMGYLRRLLGIESPWHMTIDGEDQRLQLNFADSENIQYDQVMSKMMTTQTGERVHLADLIQLETRPVIGSITREDQRYTRQVNWEYIGTDRMRQSFISDIVEGIELPYGYTAEDVSAARMTFDEEEELKSVLWITLLFIFMVLAALFESFFLPILVLLAVPMALVGVVGLFWATDSTFDSSAKIGLVLLFGIVVNNAILLINRFRLQLRELVEERKLDPRLVPTKRRLGAIDLWRLPGEERLELLKKAIIDGMRIQLRSLLLTSGTTIAGLLPLLVKIADTSEGQDIWENLALSSIGGLVSSTVLIISAIPAIYWINSRFGWVLARLWNRIRGREMPQARVVTASEAPQ